MLSQGLSQMVIYIEAVKVHDCVIMALNKRRIETLIRGGEQFCCSLVANLLQSLCANDYQTKMWFDKVIAKTEGCNFLPHSV